MNSQWIGNRMRWTVLLPVLVMLGACATREAGNLKIIPENESESLQSVDAGKEKTVKKERVSWIQKPVGVVLASESGEAKSAEFAMNFDRVPVPEFIEAMMSGVFKANYYMDEAVRSLKKRVTVKMTVDLKRDELFGLFERVLSLQQVAVNRRGNTRFFSIGKSGRTLPTGPVVYGRTLPDDLEMNAGRDLTLMVPFYNISPESLSRVLSARLPAGTTVFPLAEKSLLVMNGDPHHLRYALTLIRMLDRPQFKDRSIVMLTPTYWDVDSFQKKVVELLEADGTISPRALEKRNLVFVPLERLNSLMVIAAVPEWAQRVLYWLNKLDVPEAVGDTRNVYAYKLKNVDVSSVVEVLRAYVKSFSPPAGKTISSGKPRTAVRMEKGAGIIPVNETNTLVLVATPVMYRKYREILQKVDVPRSQVFVEVIIGEVVLRDTREIGVEFWFDEFLDGKGFGTKQGLGLGTDGARGTITGHLSGTQFEILLNGLLTDKKIDIISTPKLTVAENAEAEISVGTNVPVISSESGSYMTTSGEQNQSYYPYRSIQYLDTGIILKVKASVLTDQKIALELTQEISEASANTLTDIASPDISKRSIKTTMIVREGETAFIGGLIQRKRTRSGTGVPFLSRIPLLGNLFKKSSRNAEKTELVMFISAKTLRRRVDMQEIVEGVRKIISQDIPLEKIQ